MKGPSRLGTNDGAFLAHGAIEHRQRLLWLGSALLLLLTIAYLGNGFYDLSWADSGAGDLRRRLMEQRYFVSGVNPNEVTALSLASTLGKPLPVFASGAKISAEIGPLSATAYPPWAYAIGTIFVPTIPWWALRAYFTALNVAALGLSALWAYRRSTVYGAPAAAFLAFSTLAIFANAITLRHGQYPIVVNALLLGVLICEDRGYRWLSGILLGLSTLKPNVALLFFLVLLVRGNVRGLVAACTLTLAAAYVGAAHVHSNPIEMTRQGLAQAHDWAGHLGLFEPLTWVGLSPELVSVVGLGLGIAVAFGLMLRYRKLPALDLMAVAATIGQLCTYHRRYDQVNMLFPLLALGLLAMGRSSRLAWAAFLLFGISLWAPHRDRDLTVYPLALTQYVIWIFGLAVLLRHRLARSGPA